MTESVLTRIASGDRTAVDDCLDRYGGLVWSLAKRWVGNVDDAEDAVQDIFVELWQQAGRFDPAVAGEATFVAMIARRRLIDRRRKQSRTPVMETISVEPVDANADHGTEEILVRGEEAAQAKECLGKLSPTQQQVLTLSVHHGASHASIAGKLSLPLGTVKSYARRGLIQLRDCMRLSADAVDAAGLVASGPSANVAPTGSRS
ncbi:RNA polymerase sigma-70 factor (ECF subfamily) [Rhodopirellula rubra]|uniref:RNA polymerase sigma-70 factor (ECF subfamily) n=1 Tax=Aporhodopirellula rubra TaxID=980271 RepID=A0A7W5E4S9_9BACT|nr:sigma-70 family RNA polymerase sigma factor [Aporhodopirellula rubra]MBB3209342.1 RNA polymerase sigma-70 factor (ECF subfamily) [Aporhodopirellula rubra]